MPGPVWAGAVITGSLCTRTRRTLLLALAAALLTPASAAGQAIQEFPLAPGTFPGGITTGPDGNLWFAAEGTGDIGRMTPQGAVTMFDVTGPNPSQSPTDPTFVAPVDQITSGPDSALWFTMPFEDRIGRITTDGAPSEFIAGPGARPEAITSGPDGHLWFTAANLLRIGRITTGGAITLYGPTGAGPSDITPGPDGRLWFTESVANRIGAITTDAPPDSADGITHFSQGLTGASEPSGVTPGPGGGLWFTESAVNQVGHITPSGVITEFPGTGAGPSAIEVGRDGALWFTESEANSIGRITTSGLITNHFAVPTPGSEPSDVTAGPDGALWFTEFQGQKIGRIDTAVPGTSTTTIPTFGPLLSKSLTKSKKAKRCKVPKVKGLGIKKAKKKLRRARCRFRVKGKGYVTSTAPRAGKRTAKTVQVKAKPKVTRSR
jgi:streptogramin lyase